MNLENKTEDELAQMVSDKEQEIIKTMENLAIVDEQYHEISRKILLLESEKSNLIWPLKVGRRNIQTKKLELKMIENAYWRTRRRV